MNKELLIPCALAFSLVSLPATPDTIHFNSELNLAIESQPENDIDYIDRHLVFILDQSSSMSDDEIEILHQSILTAFETQDVLMNFEPGNRYALTFIAFGNGAVRSDTHIVSNPVDAHAAVNSVLYNDERDGYREYRRIRNNTRLNSGLQNAFALFASGESDMGIEALSRHIVIIGDDRPSDFRTINLMPLIENFHVSFSCMPIVSEGYNPENPTTAVTFYQTQIRTPANAYHFIDSYGYRNTIPSGVCPAINNPSQGAYVIERALVIGGG